VEREEEITPSVPLTASSSTHSLPHVLLSRRRPILVLPTSHHSRLILIITTPSHHSTIPSLELVISLLRLSRAAPIPIPIPITITIMRVTLLITFVVLAALSAVNAVIPASYTTAARHQQIADRINSDPTSTWTAGVNSRFVSLSSSQIRRQMGVLKTPPSMRLAVRAVDIPAALPTTFDSRQEWPHCPSIGLIRDQSDCGSCWAFGAVEAATDRICIETNATQTPMISANDLLSCCSTCGFGCGGGFLPAAWDYLVNTGVVTGGNYNDSTTSQWCQVSHHSHIDIGITLSHAHLLLHTPSLSPPCSYPLCVD
jgi:hypothetical protein